MDFEKHMVERLTALLEQGETLQFPFWGKLSQGTGKGAVEYWCFLGVAGTDLLIANYGPLIRRDGFSIRIPLNPERITIRKSIGKRKYIIRLKKLSYAYCWKKIKIVVKRKHKKIRFQEESIAGFCDCVAKYIVW